MCNLYQMTPKEDLEVFVRQHLTELFLPDFRPKTVGPFGTGIFLRLDSKELRGTLGQWGLIRHKSPSPKPGEKRYNTNNARIESIGDKPTYRYAWKAGQRCLIPAAWYAEPNWETGKNIWWNLKRADGAPWFIAGLWDEWTHPDTGEIIPSYTMLTMNCTRHPLLGRLHRPDVDPETKQVLPPEKQDKRSVVHIAPTDWEQWLLGTEDEARRLLKLQSSELFDQSDARRTDEVLALQNYKSVSLFD